MVFNSSYKTSVIHLGQLFGNISLYKHTYSVPRQLNLKEKQRKLIREIGSSNIGGKATVKRIKGNDFWFELSGFDRGFEKSGFQCT